MRRRLYRFALGLMLVMAACQEATPTRPSPGATLPASAPTPASTATPAGPIPTLESPFSADGFTLTIWVPPGLAYDPGDPVGQVLATQLAAFDDTHPDIDLVIQTKSLTGPGSILNYLMHGRVVAPDILPDLIVLSSESLPGAVSNGLIYPLTNYFSADGLTDLFPAAQDLAYVDDVLYGMPFALLNLRHLAYNQGVWSDPLPERWDDLVASQGARLAFPVAGIEGAELALQLYLGSGAVLTDSSGKLSFNEGPLTKALTRLGVARTAGLIPFNTINFTTLDEVWTAYRGGAVNMALVDSSRFLYERTQRSSSGFSAMPGPEGPLTPLVQTWSWALSTPDPAQQLLAAELIAWLTSTQNMGAWSLAALAVPARRSALDLWPGDDAYITFLREQAEAAQPFPALVDRTVLGYLRDGVVNVTTQSESAWNAAQTIINAVKQP